MITFDVGDRIRITSDMGHDLFAIVVGTVYRYPEQDWYSVVYDWDEDSQWVLAKLNNVHLVYKCSREELLTHRNLAVRKTAV